MATVKFSKKYLDAVNALEAAQSDVLPKRLTEMVKLRVSYVNGCHYCIKLHGDFLAEDGVDEHAIAALRDPVLWDTDGLFTPAEAAAIRFGEVLTDPPRGLEAAARDAAAEHYSPEEISALAEHIIMINLWNRFTRAND